MPKRNFLFFSLILGLALVSSPVLAQGIFPSHANGADANANNVIPYDAVIFGNIAYQQVHSESEFCVDSPNLFGAPLPGSGLVVGAQVGGISTHPDGPFANTFTSTRTRPNAGTAHWITKLGFTVFRQDNLNFNPTTIFFPGGFTLSYPTPPDVTRTNARLPTPITSIGPGFVYTRNPACGACGAAVWQCFGWHLNFRTTSGAGTGSLLVSDLSSTIAGQGTLGTMPQLRVWGVGAGATGFANSGFGFWQGLVLKVEAGGCKTYSDLKDEILDAVITGNPPSELGSTPNSNPPHGFAGIRNALWKKAVNSEAAFNRGSFGSAGNTLGALTNHLEAQGGKHVDSDSATDLMQCIRGVRTSLGI